MPKSSERETGQWRARPDVHLAWIGEDLVLLDVTADRYLCLPGAGASVARGSAGALKIQDAALAADLQGAGLVAPAIGEAATETIPLPQKPVASVVPERAGRIIIKDLPEMLGCMMDAARFSRAAGLAALIRHVHSSRPPQGALDLSGAIETSRRFHRWAPYAPLPAKCLLRSFMLLRLLHRNGLDATWVFGVGTWPFRAHCWLQAGEVALDDFPERLEGLSPILAV